MRRDGKVLVLLEPDPELPPPPLHLVPDDVDLVQVDSTPDERQLAGASVLYIWDHRFAEPSSSLLSRAGLGRDGAGVVGVAK